MKQFLTYGNFKFKQSRVRLCSEAKELNFFDKTVFETEEIKNDDEIIEALKNENFSKVFNTKRGGGFWIWKPYIIYKHLQLLNDNDILMYSDAGSSVYNDKYTIDKLNEYVDIVNKSEKGVLAFRNPHIELNWTKGDVFRHFNCMDNKNIYGTRQFSGGRLHVIRKCPHSLNIYKTWWETAKNYPNLFDNRCITSNFEKYQQNRHDQSSWSLICKIYGVEEEFDWRSIPFKATHIRK